MDRGCGGIRHRSSQRLTNRAALAAAAISAGLLLGACGGNNAPPTLPPAPTFVVVTATPGPPPVPTQGERQRYVVREGDTLSAIAARFGVTEASILEENPRSDPNRLLVGEELVIPAAQP